MSMFFLVWSGKQRITFFLTHPDVLNIIYSRQNAITDSSVHF